MSQHAVFSDLKTKKLLLLTTLLLWLIHAGATVFFDGRQYESVYQAGARYGMRVAPGHGSVMLYDKYRAVELTPNKRSAKINHVSHTLNFAPLLRGGTFISGADIFTVLDPILRPRSILRHRVKTIVIDPGHGGKDEGARGRSYTEKRITLALAQRLKAILEKSGYKVYLTRNRDYFIPLPQRPAIANRYQADLFLSLHVNAAKNRNVNGIETFALTPAGAPSSGYAKPERTRHTGNSFDRNNTALAHFIQQQLLRRTGAEDRGVKKARFAVLKDIRCPAVLIEVGFISNRTEERKLGSSTYLDLLARGIADGITLYRRAMQ